MVIYFLYDKYSKVFNCFYKMVKERMCIRCVFAFCIQVIQVL